MLKLGLCLAALTAALVFAPVGAAQEDAAARKEALKQALDRALRQLEDEMGRAIEKAVRSRGKAAPPVVAPTPVRPPVGPPAVTPAPAPGGAAIPFRDDFAAALNNGGQIPERLKARMGPAGVDIENQLREFLGGGALQDQLKTMLGDSGPEAEDMAAEFLEPDMLRGQLEDVLLPAFDHDPALRAEFDRMMTPEEFGATLLALLGGATVEPFFHKALRRRGIEIDDQGRAAAPPGPAPAASNGAAPDFVDELAHAMNHGGALRPSGRKLVGEAKAQRLEASLQEFLAGDTLAAKLEGLMDPADPEGSIMMAKELLGDPTVVRMQIEELLGPDMLEGEAGRQLDAALEKPRFPGTMEKLLGGEAMDPKFRPLIDALKVDAGVVPAPTTGPAPTPEPGPQINVPPQMILGMLQQAFRTGKLPDMVRQMLGPRADAAQDQLNAFLHQQPLTDRLNEICLSEKEPNKVLAAAFGQGGSLSQTFKGLIGNSPEMTSYVDELFAGDVPMTLKRLLGADPVPDQVRVLYGLLETGGPGAIGCRLAVQEDGVRVTLIAPEGGAENAGLKDGDLVRRINGKAVATADDLRRLLGGAQAGDVFVFAVERDGAPLTKYVVAHRK